MSDWTDEEISQTSDDASTVSPQRSTGRTLRHILAIVLILGSLGGLGYVLWYGYETYRARGNEELVPVIRADVGPTRVRPEQPGGLVIPHQDRLILQDLDGEGAPPIVEQLLPPPEEPMDRPAASEIVVVPAPDTAPPAAAVDIVVTPDDDPTPVRIEAADVDPAPLVEVETADRGTHRTTTEAPPAGPVPMVQIDVAPKPDPAPMVARVDDVFDPASAGGPEILDQATEEVAQVVLDETTSPALVTAPSNQASALQTTPLRPAAFQSAGALASSYRVQIAAVDSDEAARREWLRYQGRHPDLLGRLSLLVQQAEVNNRNYFRVQAGPLDEAGARRLCNALKSQDVDCLVVRP